MDNRIATLLRLPFLVVALALALAGCAAPSNRAAPTRFVFDRDTFAFANETYWVYRPDPATGRMTHENRVPPPEFAHRCFVVARAAKEFHLHARFEPAAPSVSSEEYRRLVRRVVGRSARRASPDADRVVIPGYPDLRSFSAAHPDVVRGELGGAWQSYTQRGHWRMVFPFSPSHQQREAELLAARFQAPEPAGPAVVHVVRFPALTINHALVVYGAESSPDRLTFAVYDPNEPQFPLTLVFDRHTRRFEYPPTPYFVGGRVDIYEVYRSWSY